MNRQQRRAAAKQAKKDNNPVLEEKISLFGELPDECLTCDKPFDKTNKEMAMTWSVIVHEEEKVVRLYCPDCWDRALKITEDFRQRLEEKYGDFEE